GQQRLDAAGCHRPALALKEDSLLAGMLRITQGCQRDPGVLIERHLTVLSSLALADRQQALALREGDVLPRQITEFLDPQPRVEQEPDDGQIPWPAGTFDGTQQGVLLATVEPARPRPLLGNGPWAGPRAALSRNRKAGSDACRSRPGQEALHC